MHFYKFHIPTYLFNFLFIQPWRALASTYPKLESDLASNASPSDGGKKINNKLSVKDDQLITLKCHANVCVLGWIQTSLNRKCCSSRCVSIQLLQPGKLNQTHLVQSGSLSAGLTNTRVTSFLLGIRSKLWLWESSKSCCPLGTPAVISFCLAI